jgi:hypothetical protein
MADKGKLEAIDLASVTLEDLRVLKNSGVRDALIEMIRNPESLLASGHQNHGSHSNHSTDAAKFLETEFVKDLLTKKG